MPMVAAFSWSGSGRAVSRSGIRRSIFGPRALRRPRHCVAGSTTTRTSGQSSSAATSGSCVLIQKHSRPSRSACAPAGSPSSSPHASCGSIALWPSRSILSARSDASPSGATKLLVLGATGGTGREVVSQALQQGHDVTVFVRSPQRLTVTHDGLRVLTGSVTDDGQALAAAVRAQDVVISTLGVGRSFKSEGLITYVAVAFTGRSCTP